MKIFKEKFVKLVDDIIERITCLKLCLRYTNIRDNREKRAKLRTIFINNKRPDNYEGEEPLKYANNQMVTSRYTFWNFLPKNLFEQFRRVANFYFIINSVVLFLMPEPPINPIANLVPIAFVILLTCLKQGYEDLMRHKADWEVNSKKINVLKNGRFQTVKWNDIKCGDIVQVECDSDFPCDLVLLYSTSEASTCHIKTSNLDGETNLKLRTVPFRFPIMSSKEELASLEGVINCEKPNTRLYEFKGTLTTNGNIYPITNENILLRGTTLKIAPLIYGCAIYTGKDTKMQKNFKFTSNKRSCVERKLNKYMAFFLVALILMTLFCLFASFFYDSLYETHWYITGREPPYFLTNKPLYQFIVFVFYMNLNYLIPLSLYITMEFVRFLGSKFFESDLEMYDEKTDQPAKVNNTDMCEDLGQVEYLFSDKTGTLTENQMIFKHFGLDGKIYEEQRGHIYEVGLNDEAGQIDPEKLSRFFEILSLCHTVQVDYSSVEKYNGSSPDELSFILFCTKLGIIYKGDSVSKDSNELIRTVAYNNKPEEYVEKNYELHHVLEFDSLRKRMSVIVRDCQTNEYVLYCKGADVAVFQNSICNNESKYTECLKSFSENGWRTLVLAYKVLSETEMAAYTNMLTEANNDILNREEKLASAYEVIEQNLILIGVTAVEDKLQDNVDDTIHSLRKAGIKIWVLTGDKLETAVNISESCKHFSHEMNKLTMANMSDKLQIKEFFKITEDLMLTNNQESFAIVIDGFTLSRIFDFKLQKKFRDIAVKCDSVLCCRMSPHQKAQIVKLIKESKRHPLTAAIGDGANDVSMIQEADVGIGIFGKEGRNAARAADFAFARFKFLKRALLVHGYLYYTRHSIVVSYYFYKNLAFSLIQFYFGFFSAFSSVSFFNSLYSSLFNIALTTFPISVFGLFEQQVPIKKLMENPFYYRTITKNNLLSLIQFTKWVFLAVWHSAVSFFFPVAMHAINPVFYSDGTFGDFYQLSATALFLLFLINHFKVFIIWHHADVTALIGYSISLVGFGLVCILSNAILSSSSFVQSFTDDQSLYYIYFKLFTSATMWLLFLLSIVIAMLPDSAIKLVEDLLDKDKIKSLKESYLRNAYYRNKTVKEKKPKFLKSITLPSFGTINISSSSKTGSSHTNGESGKENKNIIHKYLRQISTNGKASMTNILNGNLLKTNKSRPHTSANATHLNEAEETGSLEMMSLPSLNANANSIGVASIAPNHVDIQVNLGVVNDDVKKENNNKMDQSVPKLKSIKTINEAQV